MSVTVYNSHLIALLLFQVFDQPAGLHKLFSTLYECPVRHGNVFALGFTHNDTNRLTFALKMDSTASFTSGLVAL